MSDRMKTHGDFGWCELVTDDVDTAIRFYQEVVGWNIETMDIGMGPYHVLKTGEQPVGGIMKKPDQAGNAVNGWSTYITVDDVDQRVAQTRAAGGTVLVEPMNIPTVGRMAMIQDPTGGSVGIITYLHEG